LSSILKALKKVEESTARDLDAPVFGGSQRRGGALRAGLRRQWHQARRLGYGLLVVAMLCAAALIWFALKAGGPPKAESAAGAGKPGTEFRAKLAAPGPRAESAAPQPQGGPAEPAGRVITMRADPAPQPPGPSAPSTAVRPPGAGAAKEPPEPAPQSRPRPFAARPPAPSPPPAARPPAPARSPEDSLSRLDDSKLKVMAIAWSNDPARRVAVVNGHILKEGESVDGYSITQIRKDDIIVREGGRSWRVEFNLKTQP
jgi:hypothetical protein